MLLIDTVIEYFNNIYTNYYHYIECKDWLKKVYMIFLFHIHIISTILTLKKFIILYKYTIYQVDQNKVYLLLLTITTKLQELELWGNMGIVGFFMENIPV